MVEGYDASGTFITNGSVKQIMKVDYSHKENTASGTPYDKCTEDLKWII